MRGMLERLRIDDAQGDEDEGGDQDEETAESQATEPGFELARRANLLVLNSWADVPSLVGLGPRTEPVALASWALRPELAACEGNWGKERTCTARSGRDHPSWYLKAYRASERGAPRLSLSLRAAGSGRRLHSERQPLTGADRSATVYIPHPLSLQMGVLDCFGPGPARFHGRLTHLDRPQIRPRVPAGRRAIAEGTGRQPSRHDGDQRSLRPPAARKKTGTACFNRTIILSYVTVPRSPTVAGFRVGVVVHMWSIRC